MELGYLMEFAHVARVLNFTEAAEQLHISQPTLSKHIAQLERTLGVKLLDRDTTSVSLTEEGFYLLGAADEVQRIMDGVEQAFKTMKAKEPFVLDGRLDDPAISCLILSIAEACKDRGLPPVLFNHLHDKLPFELLKEGRIDALVDMPPDGSSFDEELEYVPLMARPMGVVLSSDNRLSHQDSVTFDDLREMTFLQVVWDRFLPGWNQIMELCRRRGFEPQRKMLQVRSLTKDFPLRLGTWRFWCLTISAKRRRCGCRIACCYRFRTKTPCSQRI